MQLEIFEQIKRPPVSWYRAPSIQIAQAPPPSSLNSLNWESFQPIARTVYRETPYKTWIFYEKKIDR